MAKFLPEFADPRVYVAGSAAAPGTRPAVEPIRIWHLLTHTAGLTYGFHHAHAVDEMYRARGYEFGAPEGQDLAAACAAWARLPLLHDPGAEWNYSVATDVLGAMLGLNKVIDSAGFDHKLIYLVEVRVSQINGCGFCIDMHTKDARLEGETEQRLYLLNAWREAPIYSDRERAALAWAEAVTNLPNGGVSDALYDAAREQFTEAELMDLTMAIVAINGWNRLAVTFHADVGSYQPTKRGAAAPSPPFEP